LYCSILFMWVTNFASGPRKKLPIHFSPSLLLPRSRDRRNGGQWRLGTDFGRQGSTGAKEGPCWGLAVAILGHARPSPGCSQPWQAPPSVETSDSPAESVLRCQGEQQHARKGGVRAWRRYWRLQWKVSTSGGVSAAAIASCAHIHGGRRRRERQSEESARGSKWKGHRGVGSEVEWGRGRWSASASPQRRRKGRARGNNGGGTLCMMTTVHIHEHLAGAIQSGFGSEKWHIRLRFGPWVL
jgi:hypothetical protein